MTLEREIAAMRVKLDELEKSARLKRIVKAFPGTPIHPGDFILGSDGTAISFVETTSDGKGIFNNGRVQWEGNIERVLTDAKRLYTQAEVEAIVGSVVEYHTEQALQKNDEGSPDDLRAMGWAVAVHNDYRNHGTPYTFWLLVKGERALKGEGLTDAEALNEIRARLKEQP